MKRFFLGIGISALLGCMAIYPDSSKHSDSESRLFQDISDCREKMQSLKNKLICLRRDMADTSQEAEGKIRAARATMCDIKELCTELGIETPDVDWNAVQEELAQRVLGSACAGLLKTIDSTLTKLCGITPPVPGANSNCFRPITQGSLPLTASTAGESYLVMEPLTHSGSSSAITVSATGVTIDLCGHQLSSTSTAAAIAITGTQVRVTNGNIETNGAAEAITLSTTASCGEIDNVSIHVTGGSADAIVNEADVVRITDLSIQLDTAALGRGVYMMGATSSTFLNRFIIGIDNITGSGLPAIHSESSGLVTVGALITDGVIRTRRNDSGSFANQSAIFLTRPSGTTVPAAFIDNVAIRTEENNRGVYLLGGGGVESNCCLRNLNLRSNNNANTSVGILVDQAQAVVEQCHVENYNEGIKLDTVVRGSVRDSVVRESTTAYVVDSSNAVALTRNAAFNNTTAGYSVVTTTDVALCDNNTVNTTIGTSRGITIAADCSRVSVESNVAANHFVGIEDLGATTVAFVNNSAINNTTNYSGVINTVSLAALGTPPEGYWHNVTP